MTLPTLPPWAVKYVALAALSDHALVMLAAMLSAELREWREASAAALHVSYRNVRDAALGTRDDAVSEWAAKVRTMLANAIAQRTLYRRAIGEAAERGLVPEPDDLRVAWDHAMAAGTVKPEDDLALTLAQAWAACTLSLADALAGSDEAKAWLEGAVVPAVVSRGYTYTVLSEDSVLAEQFAEQLREQAAERGDPLAFDVSGNTVTVTALDQSTNYELTIEQVAADTRRLGRDIQREIAALDDPSPSVPTSPPIGRSLARRLGRGRRQ